MFFKIGRQAPNSLEKGANRRADKIDYRGLGDFWKKVFRFVF